MVVRDDKPSYQGVVRGTVSYGTAGAPTTITIGQLQFVQAEKTFPADCAEARVRFGTPELHFAQLDPYDDERIVRAVVVRFDRNRFVERARSNETFRVDLEEKLVAQKPSEVRTPGRLTELFDRAARSKGERATAIIDAEFDLISWSGGRAGMVFLVASQNQLASALIARSPELHFEPALEVTLTIVLLADILLSWKNLGEKLA